MRKTKYNHTSSQLDLVLLLIMYSAFIKLIMYSSPIFVLSVPLFFI